MQKLQELTIRFQVRDDLPSERREEYRQLVIRSLNFFLENGQAIADESVMIDRMFNDHDTDPKAIELYEKRRELARVFGKSTKDSLERELILAQLQVVDAKIAKR